jgi:hypothetical protein
MSIGETKFSLLVYAVIQYFETLIIWRTFLDFLKSNGDLVNLEIRLQQHNPKRKKIKSKCNLK